MHYRPCRNGLEVLELAEDCDGPNDGACLVLSGVAPKVLSLTALPSDVRRGFASPAIELMRGLCPWYGLWPKIAGAELGPGGAVSFAFTSNGEAKPRLTSGGKAAANDFRGAVLISSINLSIQKRVHNRWVDLGLIEIRQPMGC